MNIDLFNRKILSIDFGSSNIRLVEGKYSKKGIKINKLASKEIARGSYYNGDIIKRDELVETLKEIISENKISAKRAHAVISSSAIIIRETSIPKVEKKEIAAILSFQIEDIFPVDPSDYIINYLLAGSSWDGEVEKLNLLVIGIEKIMVEEHFDLLKRAGLKPQVLDFQGNAISKLIGHADNINDGYNTEELTICSIDMGCDNTKLSIIKDGRIEISSVINTGYRNIHNDVAGFFEYSDSEIKDKIAAIENINNQTEEMTEENRIINIMKFTMENLLEEIEKILKFYMARSLNKHIDLILLQGGLANIEGITELFSSYLDIESIILESIDNIDPAIDLSKYANAIGGLIRMDGY